MHGRACCFCFASTKPSCGISTALTLADGLLQAIVLKESDVYSYKSDLESDPFGEISLSDLFGMRASSMHAIEF